ncbi:TPA: hypothetical protein PTV44_003279 [Clostridium botulinum]|nr:hypothetical protein [Clostridium botulinum]
MYPLKFENLYYENIWGGRHLELFRDNLPKGNIRESVVIAEIQQNSDTTYRIYDYNRER